MRPPYARHGPVAGSPAPSAGPAPPAPGEAGQGVPSASVSRRAIRGRPASPHPHHQPGLDRAQIRLSFVRRSAIAGSLKTSRRSSGTRPTATGGGPRPCPARRGRPWRGRARPRRCCRRGSTATRPRHQWHGGARRGGRVLLAAGHERGEHLQALGDAVEDERRSERSDRPSGLLGVDPVHHRLARRG